MSSCIGFQGKLRTHTTAVCKFPPGQRWQQGTPKNTSNKTIGTKFLLAETLNKTAVLGNSGQPWPCVEINFAWQVWKVNRHPRVHVFALKRFKDA